MRSGIICGPIWGSFPVGDHLRSRDHLRRCTVSCVSSHAVPQSISTSSLPIVSCGRYGQVGLSFEVGLVSSMVINEDDFCKLRHSRDIVKLAELKFGAFQISLGSYGKTRMRKYCSGVEPSQSLFESCLISGA